MRVFKPHALIIAGEGNILWDCITVLDDDTRARIRSLGGIRAIAVSHPHFYTRMADWAEEFDANVFVHAADRRFIVQPSERISYWTGAGSRCSPCHMCRGRRDFCLPAITSRGRWECPAGSWRCLCL